MRDKKLEFIGYRQVPDKHSQLSNFWGELFTKVIELRLERKKKAKSK